MAAETMYATVAGAGAKTGGTWANAFGMAEWITDYETNAEAGDVYYVEDGTYTIGQVFSSALNGTAAAPIKCVGVKTGTTNEPPVKSDWSTVDADRPLLAMEANTVQWNDYIEWFNFQKTGTSSWRNDTGGMLVNFKQANTVGGASTAVLGNAPNFRYIDCDITCTNGKGITGSSGSVALNCYIHDCAVTGIDWTGNSNSTLILGTIIDNCGVGVDLTIGNAGPDIINSDIYDCTTGISGGATPLGVFLNNSITSCTTGVSWASEVNCNFWDYDNFNDNIADTANVDFTANVDLGLNNLNVDPQYTVPGSDFSIADGSNMDDQAFKIRIGVG